MSSPHQRDVGADRHGVAHGFQHRQIGVGIGVREATVQVDLMQRRVVLEPGGSGLPHQRRRGEKAGTAALLVDSKLGGDDDVEQRLNRPGQRPHHASDQDGGVSRGTMLPDPAHRLRREPAQDLGSHRRVDEMLQGGQISAPIAAVHRPQEGATVSSLGTQVRRKAPHDLADFGKLTGA